MVGISRSRQSGSAFHSTTRNRNRCGTLGLFNIRLTSLPQWSTTTTSYGLPEKRKYQKHRLVDQVRGIRLSSHLAMCLSQQCTNFGSRSRNSYSSELSTRAETFQARKHFQAIVAENFPNNFCWYSPFAATPSILMIMSNFPAFLGMRVTSKTFSATCSKRIVPNCVFRPFSVFHPIIVCAWLSVCLGTG